MAGFLLLGTALLLAACRGTEGNPPGPRAGEWTLIFDLSRGGGEVEVPIRLRVDSLGQFHLHNGGEVITLDSVTWSADSFHVKLPYFQSYLRGQLTGDSLLTGYFHDPTRKADYRIPFQAAPSERAHPAGDGQSLRRIFDVHFSPGDTASYYHAIAVLDQSGEKLAGTFLTETGDYRFLSGEVRDQQFWLSCFDGAHLFYFTGALQGDSIVNGRFYSGIHWKEDWQAVRNERARLRDPDSLTYLKEGAGPFRFAARELGGEQREFGPEQFKGRVSIVQIYGSWCPNCSDESIFLRDLAERYGTKGLQVIPVAFERSGDENENTRILKEQRDELRLPYPVFLGGTRGDADRVFGMLNRIMSFPTTVFLDKRGEVRKIHTGFYGPATGSYHHHYTDRLELFVQQLLSEE